MKPARHRFRINEISAAQLEVVMQKFSEIGGEGALPFQTQRRQIEPCGMEGVAGKMQFFFESGGPAGGDKL